MNKTKSSIIILILFSIIGTACGANVQPTPEASAEEAAPTTRPATPTAAPTAVLPNLPVIGPAPEWQNDTWINTESPLRLADLQGKVVLLEFWTFG